MPDSPASEASSSDSEEELKFHEWYNDPCNDVILETTSGICLRASSYRLSQASDMFKQMFAVLPADATHDEKNIPLSTDVHTAKAFLDLISLSKPILLTADFWTITRLRDFVKLHDCEDHLIAFMETQWVKAFENVPWQGFIYASNMNDVEMARKALKHCPRYTTEQLATPRGASSSTIGGFWQFMDSLRPEWHTHLIRLIITRESYGSFRIHEDWSKLADKFDPPDPEGKRKRPVEPPKEATKVASA